MATTIATNVGTASQAATGNPGQSHLIYGPSTGLWYCFYLSGTQTLNLAYASSINSTWTLASPSFTLANPHNQEGRDFGFDRVTISGVDYVHMCSTYAVSTTSTKSYHSRFSLNSTGWATTNSETQETTRSSSSSTIPSGASVIVDSGGKVAECNSFISSGSAMTDQRFLQYPNADTAAAWTIGTPTQNVSFTATTYVTSNAFADLGSGNLLNVCDNASTTGAFTQLEWSKWGGTSWTTAATVLASSVTSAATCNWGMVARTTTEIHLVALSNNSSTYVHRIFNGTAWSNGGTINTLNIGTSSGIFLATDGTSVWMVIVDSTGRIAYCKYSGGTWSAWATLEVAGASSRSHVTGVKTVSAGAIGVIWTEANGSNFNIAGSVLGMPQSWNLDVANSGVAAPALTPSATGVVSTSLVVANASVGAPALVPAPSGAASLSFLIGNVPAGAPLLTPIATGSPSISLDVGNIGVQAPAISAVVGALATSLGVANTQVVALDLTVSGSGSTSPSLGIANVGVSAPTLGIAVSGSASLTFLVANTNAGASGPTVSGSGSSTFTLDATSVSVQATSLPVTAGGLTTGLDFANVASGAPSLPVAASGVVSRSLDVANVAVGAPSLTTTASGSAVLSPNTAGVLVQASTIDVKASGVVSSVLTTANVGSTAPFLAVAPSGSPTFLAGVADSAVAAPSLTTLATGSPTLSLAIANVGVAAPQLNLVLPGLSILDIGNVDIAAPALTTSGTGSATKSLLVANAGVAAPLLGVAASGVRSFSLDSAVVSLGASGFNVSGAGSALFSPGATNLSVGAPSFTVTVQAFSPALSVANSTISAPSFSWVGSGTTSIPLGVANIILSGEFAVGAPSNIFVIQSSMTTLIN